jgi:pyrimidine operon attenuation protein/uracil phosphoribosyltransferase
MKQVELLMDAVALDRALSRIAHQILERNPALENLGFVGMQTRGVYVARRIAAKINEMEKTTLAVGTLDATLYRDDYRSRPRQRTMQATDIPFDISDKDIILCDDVLHTGRTVRAALDELIDFGRPKTIQLAVVIDRGHRELPIRADFVGMKITARHGQEVALKVTELDKEDSLWLMQREEGD